MELYDREAALMEENEDLKLKLDDEITQTMTLKRKNLSLEEDLRGLTESNKTLSAKNAEYLRISRTFKDTLDTVLVQMSSLKETIKRLDEEKTNLERERDRLKNRGAAGFEELTPRPDYRKLMEDHSIDFNLFKEPSKQAGFHSLTF